MVDDNSILEAIKKQLGFTPEYTAFDQDIILLINAAFSTLGQIGYGPDQTFSIKDKEQKWSEFTTDNMLPSAQSYIWVSVKLAFDPPDRSYVLDALKELKRELEIRLNIQGEGYRT